VYKNYRFVFVLNPVGQVEPGVYRDEQSLPSTVTSVEVRKAKEAPNEAIFSPASNCFLTYSPIQGK
jgi:hypothetical protein